MIIGTRLDSMRSEMSNIKQVLLENLHNLKYTIGKKLIDIVDWDNQKYIDLFKQAHSSRYFQSVEQIENVEGLRLRSALNTWQHQHNVLVECVVVFVKDVTPDQYFELCAAARQRGTAQDEKNALDQEKVDQYKQAMSAGDKFPIPYVDFSNKNTAQEGRHRVAAAAALGAKIVPCVIVRQFTKQQVADMIGFERGWTFGQDGRQIVVISPDDRREYTNGPYMEEVVNLYHTMKR